MTESLQQVENEDAKTTPSQSIWDAARKGIREPSPLQQTLYVRDSRLSAIIWLKRGAGTRPLRLEGTVKLKNRRALHNLCLTIAVAVGIGVASPVTEAADTPPIVGDWTGTLDPGAQAAKRIVVHIIQEQDGTLSGSIDFPDQSMSNIPMTAITYKQSALHFESGSIQTIYDGTMNPDKTQIAGTLKQAASTISLTIKRTP